MKRKNLIKLALLALIAPITNSCDSDSDDYSYLMQPTALVTVCPQADESVILQVDDQTQLRPVNIKKLPFGKKEVRALVNYSMVNDNLPIKEVNVNWIDSIRTKMPVEFNEADVRTYGNDPLEIVNDWVTVAEDGYLTLRIRTAWGNANIPHVITLTHGRNPDKPLEFTLYQNSNNDLYGNMGDALIAFNLNEILADMPKPVKIKLNWKSFSGEKSAEFSMNANRQPIENIPAATMHNNMLE